MTFVWKLNGANLPDDVIIDTNGAGITIPEIYNVHFGLYEFTAINLKNGMEERRTFRIECEGDNTSIGNSIKFHSIMVSISFPLDSAFIIPFKTDQSILKTFKINKTTFFPYRSEKGAFC